MIINSLLDTDFYKFTMMQVVLHQYPATWVRYAFKWRNWNKMKLRISLEDFAGRIRKELDHLCSLSFKEDELKYLASKPYLTKDFIEFLRLFKFNRSYIRVYIQNNELKIKIEGPWLHTILFEVPVLATVSELYTENNDVHKAIWLPEARRRLQDKLSFLDAILHKDQNFSFVDYGTRRRADYELQCEVIHTTRRDLGYTLLGTSNVLIAKETGLMCFGTMAHEFIQAHQQLGVRLIDSQQTALQSWANEYRGELGIALSDCLGFEAFLKDFDRYFALLFDGCRHDSGDPTWWAEKLIKHYTDLRIDPRTKTAVFSDGLNFEVAVDLYRRFHTQIKTTFGIGTYFTNDCGFVAPQIVIKMVECNGSPVAKISDSLGKGMCENQEYEHYLREVIKRKTSL